MFFNCAANANAVVSQWQNVVYLRGTILKHSLNHSVIAAAFCCIAMPCSADTGQNTSHLVTYSIPEGIPTRDRFSVSVRALGDEWQEVPCYQVEVDLHKPRPSSMAYFDFDGTVEVSVTYNGPKELRFTRIRPASAEIQAATDGRTITFTLTSPRDLSIEVNGDIFDNLHLFAGKIEEDKPDPNDPNVMYFGPGIHDRGPEINIPSNTTVYLAGGAVVKSKLRCHKVENVRITGRGVLYRPQRGVEIDYSDRVTIDGVTVINPGHYTVHGGQSTNLTIRNLRSFSSAKWSDGIDMMSCSDVLIDGVFLRTSDDCIAIYAHRGQFFGDARNITVQNSTLWADVAHPVNVGTHGNPKSPEVIEQLVFNNIDILNHDEPQLGYQGCFALNASDENLIRNVRVEDVRIEDFEQGQLVNLRVTFNRTYATAPGRGIENVLFKNISYVGENANPSIISGYDAGRDIRNVVFENLVINGITIWDGMPQKPGHFATADMARIFVGEHVHGLQFRRSSDVKANPR